MSFIPHTDIDRAAMLKVIGVESIDELFHDVPAALRYPSLDLPAPTSELEILHELQALHGSLPRWHQPAGSLV